jgi:ribose transport system substrate-binding protein
MTCIGGALFLATSCGQGEPATSGPAVPSDQTTSIAPLLPNSETDSISYEAFIAERGTLSAAKQRYRVGVMVKFMGNPFWQTTAEGMRKRAEALGVDIDIRAARTEQDADGQLEILKAMLDSGPAPDALLLSPQNGSNLLPAVALAEQRGIPVINVDGALLDKARHWVGAPNFAKGEMAARYLMEQRPDGGPVAIIMGMKGIYDAQQRTAGFADTLAAEGAGKYPEVARTHADWDLQKALDAVTDILAEHPDIIGIYCNNDTMVPGATEAVEIAGKGDQVVIIGTDGIGDAIESIQAGRLDATIDPDPAQAGAIAVEAAVRLLQGESLPRALHAPQRLIDKDSLVE